MCPKDETSSTDKIEITPEMIEAGFIVLEEWRSVLGLGELAREVYIAMSNKRTHREPS